MNLTMEDVAKKLGVSISTVSLALNNSPKVAKATREKVLAAADELGYHANPYVSALMAARRHRKNPTQTPVIALITATRREEERHQLYHLRQFVEGFTFSAKSLGIRPEFFWIGDEAMTASRLNNILVSRGIRGAALMMQGAWGGKLNHPWHDVATITYGARQLEPNTDRVAADFYGNMEKSIGILQRQNMNRIGFVMDIPFPYTHDNRWLSAYLMKQHFRQIEPIKPWLDPEPTFESFKQWLDASKPEVIICVQASTVIEWLQKIGLKVPEDIGVIAIGKAENGGEISGIIENTRTCGKLAIEMLLDRIHRGEFGNYAEPHSVMVSGLWNRGETLRYLT